MISWRLKTYLDHIVETFICNCGHIESIHKQYDTRIEYQCSKCQNKRFYSVSLFWKFFNYDDSYYKNLPLKYDYKVIVQNKVIKSVYYLRLPYQVDFIEDKVLYEDLHIYEKRLDNKGNLTARGSLNIPFTIKEKLEKDILIYINNHDSLKGFISKKYKLTYDDIRFFFEHPHLKSYEFIFWDSIDFFGKKSLTILKAFEKILNFRKEKSIKKSLFSNYQQQIESTGIYKFKHIYAYSKTILDPNILVKFIQLEIIDFDVNKLINMIVFFKSNNYSDLEVYRIFNKINSKRFNTYEMLEKLSELISTYESYKLTNFKKVKVNPDTMVRELEYCIYIKTNPGAIKEFLYPEHIKRRCISFNNYSVVLPKNGFELYTYANMLNNCMKDYFNEILSNHTHIYIFKYNNKIKFAVEVKNEKIVQARSKCNEELDKSEKEALKYWGKKFLLKKDSSESNLFRYHRALENRMPDMLIDNIVPEISITKEDLLKMIENEEDISQVDTSNIIDMSGLFMGRTNFNQDISNWDVSSVTNMQDIFSGCKSFNQDISSWDVSRVSNMEGMFSGCKSFNQNISNWDVSNVKNMSFMFDECTSFNRRLTYWNVSRVIRMNHMFFECKEFNQDISNWDVSSVEDMSCMFTGCEKFNQELKDWNVSKVKDMSFMFEQCKSFNQSISQWDIDNTTDVTGMFSHSNLYEVNAAPTKLLYAIKNLKYTIFVKALKSCMDVNKKDEYGRTALHIAAGRGHIDMVESLLEHSANCTIEDDSQDTALILASKKGFHDVIEVLVENGVNINQKDVLKRTSLHYSCMYNSVDTVKYLLDNGAQVNRLDENKQSPLDIALEIHAKALVRLLKEYGAKTADDIEKEKISQYVLV